MSSHSVRMCRFAWRRLRGGGEGSIKMMAVLGKEGRVGQVIVPVYGPIFGLISTLGITDDGAGALILTVLPHRCPLGLIPIQLRSHL